MFLARLIPLALGVVAGWLIFVLAARAFGPRGGLVAGATWLTIPAVVGLAHLTVIDVAFTVVTLATSVVLWRWLEHRSDAWAAAVGLVCGLALATRHTALVLVAVAVLVVVLGRGRRLLDRMRSAGVVGLVAIASLWAVYLVLDPGAPGDAAEGLRALAGSGSLPSRVVGSLPLPLEWRAGLGYLDLTSADRPSSLLGRSWDGSRWWYYPASVAIKVPATALAAVALGWVAGLRRSSAARRDLAVVVGLPAVAIAGLLLAQPLNLGLRLALPVLALGLVGAGGLGPALRRRGPAVAVAVLAVIQVGALIVATPHSLAWNPPPFQPSYRWASGADLDYGQDLYRLRDWLDGRRARVAYARTRGLRVGDGARPLVGVDPAEVRGWVAVGVTALMENARDALAWLRKYCPVDTIGGSILIYRFVGPPDPSPGPERPVAPCFGADASRVRPVG